MNAKTRSWGSYARTLGATLLIAAGASCTVDSGQLGNEESVGTTQQDLNGVLGTWTQQGPFSDNNGGDRNVSPNNKVDGAIRDIAVDPTNGNVAYVGSVAGGLWKTTNFTAASPTWTPLTDSQTSLSIGGLSIDPTNTNQLLAGVGRFSSFVGSGGPLNGLLLTRNAGATWTPITNAVVVNQNFTAVALSGNTLLGAATGGFFRSADDGTTWSQVSGAAGSGLPNGTFFDVKGDPSTAGRYYAVVQSTGVFRSDNFGATWTNVTNGALQTAIQAAGNDNAKIGIGLDGRVYVIVSAFGQESFIATSANAGGVWTTMDVVRFSNTGTVAVATVSNTTPITVTTSAPHNLPCASPFPINVRVSGDSNATANGDFTVTCVATPPPALQPFSATQFTLNRTTAAGAGAGGNMQLWNGLHTVGQSAFHFAIAVDPTNSKLVYIAGDASTAPVGGSGNIWRGDTRIAANNGIPSSQWANMTDGAVAGIPGGGTASLSSPHSDSRRMVFDANGNLLLSSDGGIFSRTSPQNNTGDWFSKAGNMNVFELHDGAFDPISRIALGSAQDNGTPEQTATGSSTWTQLFGGDGGDVAVDAVSARPNSLRYYSSQGLQGLTRQPFNAANASAGVALSVKLQVAANPAVGCVAGDRTLPSGGAQPFIARFRPNVTGGNRLVIGANTSVIKGTVFPGVYESINASTGSTASASNGDCLQSLAVSPAGANVSGANGFAYGNTDNANVLWVASQGGIFVRTTAAGALTQSATFTGGAAVDVVMKPGTSATAYVVTGGKVWATTDTGTTWTDVTGDLGTLKPGTFRALAYVPGPSDDRIVLAADGGVFVTSSKSLGFWNRLGTSTLNVPNATSLPNVPAWGLDYDATSDTLLVSTMGRGSWTFVGAKSVHLPPAARCQNVTKNANSSCQATVTPAEVNRSSFGPDGNSVTAVSLNPAGPFTRGSGATPTPTTTTLTVSDSTGAQETCTATITVLDATAPTFSASNPTTLPPLVACQPTAQTETLTAPTATDICGCLNISGSITQVNGTASSIPLTPTSPGSSTFQGTLPIGALTVEWIATNCDGVASAPFDQTVQVVAAPALYARQLLSLDTIADVVTSGGQRGTIDNNGTVPLGITTLGIGTTAGDVLTVPGVTLTGSNVDSVVSGAAIIDIGATINGTSQPFTTPVLPPFPTFSATYPANLNEIIVLPLLNVPLAPGPYDNVVVSPGGTLTLSHGTYTFNTLNVAPDGTIAIDNSGGEVDVDVQTEITHLGAVNLLNGTPNQFVLGYSGVFPVLLLTNFSGVVIAPTAAVTLSQPLFGAYQGAFFAQDILVAAGVKVTEYPYQCH